MIIEPVEYWENGLTPELGLSQKDIEQARLFYPPLEDTHTELKLLECTNFTIGQGEQVNFTIIPKSSNTYNIRTFGGTDTVMILFENDEDDFIYVMGDDDSGTNRNSNINTRLTKGRKYTLRIRLYSECETGGALVLWSRGEN